MRCCGQENGYRVYLLSAVLVVEQQLLVGVAEKWVGGFKKSKLLQTTWKSSNGLVFAARPVLGLPRSYVRASYLISGERDICTTACSSLKSNPWIFKFGINLHCGRRCYKSLSPGLAVRSENFPTPSERSIMERCFM
jgi:hypothetical protein